ncbi:hypothetical protein [Vibrio parahaemolyticus]|uniref:hypothetical protein n=1 Tax=Vibrio parahaemolyticus TaxID=670 RepID=UPI001D162EAC|nr:hypothetical protein [Vibrio parahaemolyticus]MCC3788990.1 hypothetical protein [Vibrio parahaemolyticus]MCC3836566.1 hypothetical protein [Vibrio parahaemolyticus]MCC3841247.1 hypothetical protein [Vibrio parahaemolyticus]
MNPSMVALHSHWLNADAVKVAIYTDLPVVEGYSSELQTLSQLHSSFRRISVFYSLLYVVIEGYRELGSTDDKVDSLLKQCDFVDALRLFRNATFHYQKAPIPEKAMKFLEAENSENWIQDLHIAFRQYFEQQLPIKDTMEKLKA